MKSVDQVGVGMGRTRQVRSAETNGNGSGQEEPGLEEVLDLMIHELRNPIAVMKGFATTFENALDRMDPGAIEKGAVAIRRGVDKLDALLTSLKDARSLDLNELELDLRDVEVSALVNDTVKDQKLLHDRAIEVFIEDDAFLNVDSVRVRQVLTNLISNAIKFSPRDEPVAIVVQVKDKEVHVCIRDHGDGIDPTLTDRLFQKFSRLTTDVNGTGIGLYISRGIARAHGGDVVLAENSPEGCTFLLKLPIPKDRQ